MKTYNWEGVNPDGYFLDKLEPIPSALPSFQKLFQVSATALSRSEERFSRNAETELVCRLLLEKKKLHRTRLPFWAEAAEAGYWYRPWNRVLDGSLAPFFKWF